MLHPPVARRPRTASAAPVTVRRRGVVARRAGLLGAVLATAVTTGCSAPLDVPVAPAAQDPLCAEVVLALPVQLGALTRLDTGSQGTAAWGERATAVVLRCGVEVPGPSSLLCVTVADDVASVDWLELPREADETVQRYLSFGRAPAVEVAVPVPEPGGGPGPVVQEVLLDLGPAVSQVPATAECTGGP